MSRKSKIKVEPLDFLPLAQQVGELIRQQPRTESIVGIIPGARYGLVKINDNYYLVTSLGGCSFLPINNLPQTINFYPMFSDESVGFSPVHSIVLELKHLKKHSTKTYENLADFILHYGFNGDAEFCRLNIFFSDQMRKIPEGNFSHLVSTSGELKKFAGYLVKDICKCKEYEELVAVAMNICTCGEIKVHSHCRNCGGIPLKQSQNNVN